MAQKTFTSTFQRNIETSWEWFISGYGPGAAVYWTTSYRTGGGPTILAQDYTVNFDISDLPASAIITNVGITFPWHNTSRYITSDLTIKIGDTIKYLPSTSTSGIRYRLITFDSIGSNYTKSGTTLTVPVAYFRYAGTKPSNTITTKQGETPSVLSGAGGWFTGYNPSASPTGYADEAVYITVDYTAATQGGSNNGAGGAGGGGRGNYKGNTNSAGVAGTENTGGGGGGAGYYYANGTATISPPGAGGSGVVIIRNTRF